MDRDRACIDEARTYLEFHIFVFRMDGKASRTRRGFRLERLLSWFVQLFTTIIPESALRPRLPTFPLPTRDRWCRRRLGRPTKSEPCVWKAEVETGNLASSLIAIEDDEEIMAHATPYLKALRDTGHSMTMNYSN